MALNLNDWRDRDSFVKLCLSAGMDRQTFANHVKEHFPGTDNKNLRARLMLAHHKVTG